MTTSYLNLAALAAHLLLQILKAMQEKLFESLTHVYKGHIDVHFLTPVDLVEVNVISGRLPKAMLEKLSRTSTSCSI